MPRALPAISIVLLILLSLFWALVLWNNSVEHRQKESTIASFSDYYKGLARGCYEKESVECCLSSVSAMQEKKALLIPENGCSQSTKQDMMKCVGSYTWCEKPE